MDARVIKKHKNMYKDLQDNIEGAKDLSALTFKHYEPRVIRLIGELSGVIDKEFK